jgi:hypothetical protein
MIGIYILTFAKKLLCRLPWKAWKYIVLFPVYQKISQIRTKDTQVDTHSSCYIWKYVDRWRTSSRMRIQIWKKGDTYVELHVDDHPKFQADCEHLPFGGHLSVRKGVHEKPLTILGQDKCIFKQFNLSSKSWSDPNGTNALLPKDEGQGVMISAFVSH